MLIHLLLACAALAMRFAVLDFQDASTQPGYEALGTGLQSMLTTDLAVAPGLTVVERARLAEIREEIALGSSGAVDPATAAEVGRLSGASHLVTGTTAVVGDEMRIDARLFDTATGEVVLARAVQGEREAFFELEKELASALLVAVEVDLAPRERAELSRIHTADWEAFSDFSSGIRLFDQERYDEAVAALQRATDRDDRFELARLTLEDYEEIISEMGARADALEVTRAEQQRLERLAEAAEEAAVLARLVELTQLQGNQHRRQRLTALYLLAVSYANIGTNQGKLHRLRATEDRFAMARAGDVYARRYVAEARQLWPAVPLLLGQGQHYGGLPESVEEFDEGLAWAEKRLWDSGLDHPENRRSYLWGASRYPRDTARLLHLDASQELDLREELLDKAMELGLEDYQREDLVEALWKEQRRLLRLDESTAGLRRLASGTENEHALRGFKEEIERNRDLVGLLEEAESGAPLREWLMGSTWSHGPKIKAAREHFLTARTDAEGLRELHKLRKLDDEDYVLVGEVPVWAHQSHFYLSTGPRSDPRRASSLRYHRASTSDDPDPLLLLEGVPRKEARVSLVVDWRVSEDFWSREEASGQPAVLVLLGAVDVDCAKQRDPVTDQSVLARPMRSLAVRLGGGKVELLRIVEVERGSWDRKQRFDEEVLGKGSYRDARVLEVDLSARGSEVVVEVNGKRSRFTGVELEQGFLGLRFEGTGHVEVSGLGIR